MSEATDTIILHQELAYADTLPLKLTTLTTAPDAGTLTSWAEKNFRLLQACAALDESSHGDGQDESTPHALDLQRIDLKLNMLLDLLGLLVASNQARPAPCALRFNAQGLVWQTSDAVPGGGTAVTAELYLRDSLVHPLTLTGVMQATDVPGLANMRFDELPENIADHIKRMVFRRHRRQVAVTRSARRA